MVVLLHAGVSLILKIGKLVEAMVMYINVL